ncbi:sirohydrochlorin chelatase [Winogradskya humida]|uniref:CbiX protein n=1 Tax=Winogradskya humida TaxID=113566 RepID=A0ABQ3ZJY3_9ACTN|nr:CbiX/SirB N-terminal domain-containing protein [Actinoplanes humidus]GIE18822.1 hypothetical protein Ahu01nite_019240 [Actinoplanes humidus]
MRRLVAVAHGTRSVAGQEQIRALVDRVALRLPGTEVRLTYVDVQHPRVETMTFGVGTVVVPLLLSTGHHVRVDIANAVAGSGAVVTPPLGPDAVLVASMRRPLSGAAAVRRPGDRGPRGHAIRARGRGLTLTLGAL